jgi:hypothetical protein
MRNPPCLFLYFITALGGCKGRKRKMPVALATFAEKWYNAEKKGVICFDHERLSETITHCDIFGLF